MKQRSIKHLKPNSNSHYSQGYYVPINESKYVGPKPVIYRSSWELQFSEYCDVTPEVIYWSSEPVGIRYWNLLTKKFHTYFPDYVIKLNVNGKIDKYIIEIKPKAQLVKPKPPKTNTSKAILSYKKAAKCYVVNLCKLEALKKFAEANGYKVKIITDGIFNLENGRAKK